MNPHQKNKVDVKVSFPPSSTAIRFYWVGYWTSMLYTQATRQRATKNEVEYSTLGSYSGGSESKSRFFEPIFCSFCSTYTPPQHRSLANLRNTYL